MHWLRKPAASDPGASVIVQLTVLILLTIVFAGVVLTPRHVETRVVFKDAPDVPKAFGPDMAWLAVRTTDTGAVLASLGIAHARPANWSSGIGAIYDPSLSDTYIFVAPPVEGWTLVAGVALPLPAGKAFEDKLTPLIGVLAQTFSQVQYFAAFPGADYFGWAHVENRRWVRAFAVSEEGVVLNEGRLTPAEKSLGLKLFEVRGIRGRKGDIGGPLLLHPTEDHVLSLAAGWSVNPAGLSGLKGVSPATGFVAEAPLSWRAELKRRAA